MVLARLHARGADRLEPECKLMQNHDLINPESIRDYSLDDDVDLRHLDELRYSAGDSVATKVWASNEDHVVYLFRFERCVALRQLPDDIHERMLQDCDASCRGLLTVQDSEWVRLVTSSFQDATEFQHFVIWSYGMCTVEFVATSVSVERVSAIWETS